MFPDAAVRKAVLKSIDKSEFKNSNCCLTISVGQDAHEGENLRSTIDSVNKAFKSCTIIIGDTLQRHNIQILSPYNAQQAEEKSRQLGHEWYERNYSLIDRLSCPYKVLHWDYWRFREDFAEKYTIIQNLYKTSVDFMESVHSVSNEFLERNLNKMVLKYKKAFELSKEYLLEECAGMLLWAKDGIHFDVYPSRRNKAMDFVYQHVISIFNTALVRPVRVKFKSRLVHNELSIEDVT